MLLPMSAIQDFPSYTTRVNRTAFECAIDGKSYCRIFVKDGDQIAAIRLDESESPTAPQDESENEVCDNLQAIEALALRAFQWPIISQEQPPALPELEILTL